MSGDPFRLAAPGHPYSVAVAASQVINQGRRLSLDLGLSRSLATTTAFVLDQIDELAVVFDLATVTEYLLERHRMVADKLPISKPLEANPGIGVIAPNVKENWRQ